MSLDWSDLFWILCNENIWPNLSASLHGYGCLPLTLAHVLEVCEKQI